MSAAIVKYDRARHAAHAFRTGEPLWDLSSWTVAGGREAGPPQIDRVEYSHGFVDKTGQQFSVWTRKEVAHPEKCERCRP